MLECSFNLNNQPLSTFTVGAASYPAFSGKDPYINKRAAACIPGIGPIPPGDYYIFDRQSGGFLGQLYDGIRDRSGWFALHAMDGRIDDETYCEKVKRGAFRLHPKGPTGVSEGCIVVENKHDFVHLSTILRRAKPQPINGSKLLAYGKVHVK